jgi:hypothetical protein
MTVFRTRMARAYGDIMYVQVRRRFPLVHLIPFRTPGRRPRTYNARFIHRHFADNEPLFLLACYYLLLLHGLFLVFFSPIHTLQSRSVEWMYNNTCDPRGGRHIRRDGRNLQHALPIRSAQLQYKETHNVDTRERVVLINFIIFIITINLRTESIHVCFVRVCFLYTFTHNGPRPIFQCDLFHEVPLPRDVYTRRSILFR